MENIKKILKGLNLKDAEIELIINEETEQEQITKTIAAVKARQDEYYENQVFPGKKQKALEQYMPIISVKKLINKKFGLGISSNDLNEKEEFQKIETLFDMHLENIESDKANWNKGDKEELTSEITKWKEKYEQTNNKLEETLNGMDEFKSNIEKQSQESLRVSLVEQSYAKMERGKKDILSDGKHVSFSLQAIKDKINKEYKVMPNGDVLDPKTGTKASYPGEDRLIDKVDDIWMFHATEAGIIKTNNGNAAPKVLNGDGKTIVATGTMSKEREEKMKRIQEKRMQNGG